MYGDNMYDVLINMYGNNIWLLYCENENKFYDIIVSLLILMMN